MSYLHHAILSLICAACMAALPASAQNSAAKTGAPHSTMPAPIVEVVDVQRILDESLAAKSVQKQLDTQRSKFQSEIEKEENELSQAEKDLAKARDQLTPDIYSDREQQLRQRFAAEEQHVQARRKVLDEAFSDSMNAVRTNLLDIVSSVAHEHGANLVLIKQQVLWTDKALDVTDEVLNRLNQRLPQVTVKMAPEEQPEKPPAAK
jgi:outer membrane protein